MPDLNQQAVIDAVITLEGLRDHVALGAPGIYEHDLKWYAALVSTCQTLLTAASKIDGEPGQHRVPTSSIEALTTTLEGLLRRE
jgi:hypothetical protein